MEPIESELQFIRNGINLRLVARRQRMIIWLIFGAMAASFLPHIVRGLLVALRPPFLIEQVVGWSMLGLQAFVVVWALLLAHSTRTSFPMLVLCGILMCLPLINLIVLLLENRKATFLLEKNGLDVGFLGLPDEVVVRMLSTHLCPNCGYNLTGNVSGTCPECGQLIRDRKPSRLVENRPT